jgi:tetratricopeptide (TPR) repeat protein
MRPAPHTTRRLGVALVVAVATFSAACGRMPPPVPELWERSRYEKIFAEIDRAETIADPVQRCREYPPLPHIAWPQPLVEALCRDNQTPIMKVQELKDGIDRGEWQALHDRYAGYLQRHHSGEDPELLVYRVFFLRSWKDHEEMDDYTGRWVAAVPDDPFANAERGAALTTMAWNARGDEGTEAQVRAHAERAETHLRKAIAEEPRLLTAYLYLIDAHVLQGRRDAIPETVQAALRQSPTSFYIRDAAAQYLHGRWGGSPQGLYGMALGAEPHVGRNPRLALLATRTGREIADRHSEHHRDRKALWAYRAALAHGPEHETLLNAGFTASELEYYAEKIMYLSQDIRFNRSPKDARIRRGLLWEWDGKFERALRDFRAAAALDPEDAWTSGKIEEIEARMRTATTTTAR